jgi:hypothetical protein
MAVKGVCGHVASARSSNGGGVFLAALHPDGIAESELECARNFSNSFIWLIANAFIG